MVQDKSTMSKVYLIAKVTSAQFEKHLDSLYRAALSQSLATSHRALMLLEKILYPQGPLPDRYYTSMYDLLYSQSVINETNTHPALISMVYKSGKIDANPARIASFVKRLLQMSLISVPTFTIGALMVVAELLSENRALFHSLLTEKEDEEITVVKVDNELNTMKMDKEIQLNKQKKQIKSNHTNSININNINSLHSDKYDPSKRNPHYSCADVTGLWEIRILASHYHPTVSHLANQILQAGFIESQKLEKIRKLSLEKDIRNGIDVKLESNENEAKSKIGKYKFDTNKINNTNDLDSINALDMLKVNYISDPFEDFSHSAFLNRFAFKNPKKKKNEEDDQQKNENKKDQKKLQSDITLQSSEHRLNSIEFTKQSQSYAAPHEQFFFKYFAENPAMQRRKRIIEKKLEEKERKAKLQKKLEIDSKLKSKKDRRSRFGDEEDDDEIEDDELDAYLQKLGDEAVGKGYIS
ncbi:MAG: putative ribosome biogenesis protein Noc1 [Streblomastix strix]|uniref:Putative ribosome biogenesis protein Noc1 n=1 Tax=Streblomastix strix TaxID=222440 RepID=A0A5J4V029_9EUKA|nr:MAG: putative ribosome biogenesis protein Noc1 [Streblomastix strix]